MSSRTHAILLGASLLPALGALSGCGSAYSGMVGSSGLGAAEYIPSVYVDRGTKPSMSRCCKSAARRPTIAR